MTACAGCSAGWVLVAGPGGDEPARCPTCCESTRPSGAGVALLEAIMAADRRHTSRDRRGRWGRVAA